MFARTVRMHLKPNSVAQFTETMERDVIPLLRKQQGFKDEITLLPADGSGDAVAISFWEKRENADAYQRDAYPDVLRAVAKVADGTPNVQMSEVSNSTWHKIAAR
jgi:pyruvate/2-oxoglutarate dehydrogenase complex dihydrolipoamide acyltransferase (E2) component